MKIFIQLLIIAISFGIPYAYYVKKARIEVTAGLSFMFGVSLLTTEYEIQGKKYDRSDLMFSIGPINAVATWIVRSDV